MLSDAAGGNHVRDAQARKDFHHPFEPYDIQDQLMHAVYACIEGSKVGIFESPTGTGKSLSLICGSLTWLREHKRKTFDESIAAIQPEDGEPEWMVEHAKTARKAEARQIRAELDARLQAVRQRDSKVRERQSRGEPSTKKRKLSRSESQTVDADEAQFLLDEYESNDEDGHLQKPSNQYSNETTKLMQKLGMVHEHAHDGRSGEAHEETKIFFCSRTHSQLSQFIGELKRVNLPPGLPPEPEDAGAVEGVKHLTLGSRKNLCINSKVTKLGTTTAMNERCVELQQPSTRSDQKCPYLPSKDEQNLVLDFRDQALAQIRDIEDLAAAGKEIQVCPYYASRTAISPAEIVTLPYPLLLQKSAREALGISLKDHVVIIDEAHNLISAIEGIHSTQITKAQLGKSRACLMLYLQKFRNRLKGGNRVYVTQVVRVIDSLLLFLSKVEATENTTAVVEASDLLKGSAVDQINLSKLVRYMHDSKLGRKVEGYASYVSDSTQEGGKGSCTKTTPEVPTLTLVQNFLHTLMNPSKEGRFFWSKEDRGPLLRYLLLDPSEHFRDVVEDARAVILAGGTMSPIEDYKQQLFPYLSSLQTLSCGHLIPQSNLMVRTIASDNVGKFELSYKTRTDPSTASRLGAALLALGQHIADGMVVFFPSYTYLGQVLQRWRQDNTMEKLEKLKPVFADSRDGSGEDTFRKYSEAVKTGRRGALLLSVIGGKLSEGINFSDDLGRCVLVVGLPFPNLETPEWKAKMLYVEDKAVARGEQRGKASREHAENVCMRSVNQAIGRVIRHKDDWASILLMDSRYSQPRIKDKLPGWIKECFREEETMASSGIQEVARDLSSFMKAKTESDSV